MQNTAKNFSYQFVPMGTVAPDQLQANEIWLDVGNRATPQVLDHHGGDTAAESAAQLVFEHFIQFIAEPLKNTKEITLVLHAKPDLDAVTSAWLTVKLLTTVPDQSEKNAIQKIIRSVSDNDQGRIKTETPLSCWPIVIKTLLSLSQKPDIKILTLGSEALDKTLQTLLQGATLEDAASLILTENVRTAIEKAKQDYRNDLAHGQIFQARLPARDEAIREAHPQTKQTDGLVLTDPTSVLFKELARADTENSPQHKGFTLLVVVITTVPQPDDRTLTRYIISTDPTTEVHLGGLGKRLEMLEQEIEDSQELPLLAGRERLSEGAGRFGYNVNSPWYDGRGHGFTIVDSPSIIYDAEKFCGSCLLLKQVMDCLQNLLEKKTQLPVRAPQVLFLA